MTQTVDPLTPPGPPPPVRDAEPAADAPPAPDRAEMSTATRYLCVGAYRDSDFRNRSLREVYHQHRRFVAPSHGFDLVTVLDACLRARNLEILRDASIVLVLAVATYLNWLSAAVVVAAIVFLRVTGAAWRLVRAFLFRARSGTAVDTTKSPRRGLLMLLGWAATVIVLTVLAGKVVAAAEGPATGGRSLGLTGALPLALVVFVLPGLFALGQQKRVEEFTVDGRPTAAPRNDRMREIAEQQRGNTVVYSNFEPFIGSGDVIKTWSFAQRLIKKAPDIPGVRPADEGRREFPEPPFRAVDIVDHVRGHLRMLAVATEPELGIHDMSVTDRIFQSAREFGKKTLETSPEEVAEIIRDPTHPQRHYLVCQGIGWGGDVVTTVHIHLAVQGRSLYLEVTTTNLAPCNDRYRVVDEEGGTGPRAWLWALLHAVRDTPATIVHTPQRLARSLADVIGNGAGAARPRSRRRKDDGARVSVRQLGTRDKLRNFTQLQDVIKFRKLIESRVYAHVLDFLDEHKVDTSEVRAQRATILNNNGIFVGGDMSVGEGSVTNQAAAPSTD
jgi:hypothetical protein